MDESRLGKLKVKLQIGDWENVSQKQFNDLVTNLSFLDQETVRTVIRNIPDLSSKVLAYLTSLNESVKMDTKEYLEAMKIHNELLMGLVSGEQDPKIKTRIADELLEHSRWLRKEATATRIFKMAVASIGMGLAFLFIRSMTNSNEYRPSHAKADPNRKEDTPYPRDYHPTDYNRFEKDNYHPNEFPSDQQFPQQGMYPMPEEPYRNTGSEKSIDSHPVYDHNERRRSRENTRENRPQGDFTIPWWIKKPKNDEKNMSL